MNILNILKIIAAIATSATGVFALVKPSAIYGFTGLVAQGVRGTSEIRAIFGGLFIALGIAPFIFGPVGLSGTRTGIPGNCRGAPDIHRHR